MTQRNNKGSAYREYRSRPASRVGLFFIALMHIALGWALYSGHAQQLLQHIAPPMATHIVQEAVLTPPPQPPKPMPTHRNSFVTPVPTYIPPPESAPVAQPALIVAASAEPQPQHPPVPLVPLDATLRSGMPAAPPEVPAKVDIAIVCTDQPKPQMPRAALRQQLEGRIEASVRIADGRVKEVSILSGPAVFHEVVRTAMLQYHCNVLPREVTGTQVDRRAHV